MSAILICHLLYQSLRLLKADDCVTAKQGLVEERDSRVGGLAKGRRRHSSERQGQKWNLYPHFTYVLGFQIYWLCCRLLELTHLKINRVPQWHTIHTKFQKINHIVSMIFMPMFGLREVTWNV